MHSTDGNNNTGWGRSRYDELLNLSSKQPDPKKRFEYLHDAKTLILEDMPI